MVKKKGIMIIAVFLIIAAIIGGLFLFKQSTIWEGCLTTEVGEDDLLCLTINKINSIIPFTISTTPSNPLAGEVIDVVLTLEMPQTSQAISVAKINFQRISGGLTTIKSWDILNSIKWCEFGGCSFVQEITTIAPLVPGEYRITSNFQAGGSTILTESLNFEIGSGECPDASCTNWNSQGSINHGQLQSRQCSTFSESPECNENIRFERRQICDNGFLVEGLDTPLFQYNDGAPRSCVGQTSTTTETTSQTTIESTTPTTIAGGEQCITTSDCTEIECNTVECQSSGCQYTAIDSCSLSCKNYESIEENGCSFNIVNLFTGEGIKDFWNDFRNETITVGVLIILLIVVLIITLRKKSKGGL